MRNVKSIKSDELFPAVTELLENGHSVKLTVTGNSMMPFLREDIDSIELSIIPFSDLHFLQIPLIKRESGQYILHRLIFKRKNSFYIAGDAHMWVEGPVLPSQLVAVVSGIWRGNRFIDPHSFIWYAASLIWWLRLPIRYSIKVPRKLIKLLLKHTGK